MKKIFLVLLIAIGFTTVSIANETPGVKLGELVNGTTKITYDRSKLHHALGYLLESEDIEIDSTQIFLEDDKYYLWALIKDKTTKLGTGKITFSLEKSKSDLILTARPVYIQRCLGDRSCSTCYAIDNDCYCYIGSGNCTMRSVYVGDDGQGSARYSKTFDDLLRSQKSQ